MARVPIDWQAPWLGPWREVGELAAREVAAGAPVHASLNQAATRWGWHGSPAGPDAGRAPVRFVPQDALPADQAYEAFVFDSGCCPTREGLHDFFNGLCWLAMPASKRALNALQAAEIGRHGVGTARGPVRDAITVFDENGALLAAPTPLWQALLARQWRRLFVDLRHLWAQARLLIFGHALLEKLVAPRKDMTAHVWRVPVPLELAAAGAGPQTSAWDAWLSGQLLAPTLAAKPFTPLPVLGVPGWCPDNENPAFYEDARVFRPASP